MTANMENEEMAKLSANGATILARYRKGDAKAALRSDGAFLVAWIKGDGYSIHHKTRAANKLEPRALISMWDDWSAERGWTKEGIVTTNPNLSDDVRLGRKAPDPNHPVVFTIVPVPPLDTASVDRILAARGARTSEDPPVKPRRMNADDRADAEATRLAEIRVPGPDRKTSSLHSAGTRVTMVGKTERDPNQRPRNMENRTMATKSTATKTQATATASPEMPKLGGAPVRTKNATVQVVPIKKSPTEAELRALVAPFVKEGATASATIKALRAKGYSFSGKKVRVHFEGRTVKSSPAKATIEQSTSRQKARAAKTAKANETRETRVQPPAPKPAVRKGAAFIDPDEVAKTRRANREAARAATQDLVTHGSFAEDAPKTKKAAVRKTAATQVIAEAPKGTPSVKPPVRGIARSSTRRAMATASK